METDFRDYLKKELIKFWDKDKKVYKAKDELGNSLEDTIDLIFYYALEKDCMITSFEKRKESINNIEIYIAIWTEDYPPKPEIETFIWEKE